MKAKKLGVMLFLILLLCGCQPTETDNANNEPSESVQSNQAVNTTIEEPEEDPLAIRKFLALCTFSEDNKHLKEEFLALVKEAKIEEDKYILTIDKIEATNNIDVKDDFYTNSKVKNEEYMMDIDNGETNAVIVVDPHNNFRAVTLEGLKEYIHGLEDGLPFYFYSLDGDLVLLLEMMLP